MRKFICVGGSHDGELVSISHGSRVLMASSNEEYNIYTEPLGLRMGVLIASSIPDDQIMPLLEEKFPSLKLSR